MAELTEAAPGAARAEGVGPDIRALRKARGVTLADLAAAARRSVGWLSQVERGLSEPTIADLRRLADRLSAPLGLFFGDPAAPPGERGVIVRRGAGRRLGGAAGGLTEELLSPDLGGEFEVLRSVFAPGAELYSTVARPTEEAGYLVAGDLDIWIGGRLFHLHRGDSFRLRGDPFRWRNPGEREAVAIWVISPPIY
ncbi:helix-turn-helix domain-containing protein [Pikeienuella piscinae]|uniref:Helix-turn-helix domain-containing protein n=1 Tax=Pikeienuella piscinae TaxID=2748098 RepID=A0A7L5BUF6_9RHOB|nr:helix-turn-helix domain-containing protein [Pikeienuella piscinae]QIE54318.1 helix-turn-helix domain-containing protein [Pikeienuella piscinae]